MRKHTNIHRAGAAHAVALLGLLMANPSVNAVDISVNPAGSPYPEAPSGAFVDSPFQSFLAGVCLSNSPAVNNVQVAAGNYPNERGVVSRPAVIHSVGGTARIGEIRPNSTTLRVLTYNTHLFGSAFFGIELPGTVFADGQRAAQIGDKLAQENVDVVVLQEVWDDALGDILIAHANYPYVFFDTSVDEVDDAMGSGLMVLSRLPLIAPSQAFFDNEDDINFECGACIASLCFPPLPACSTCLLGPCSEWLSDPDSLASKGFTLVTVQKNGFRATIFNTHTQSGGSEEAFAARISQFLELQVAINQWRAFATDTEVILCGDLNANALTSPGEYYDWCLPLLGLRDAYRNAPCTIADDSGDPGAQTFATDNDLVSIFGFGGGARYDHMHYSMNNSNGYHVLPVWSEIKHFEADPPIEEDGQVSVDLSDHHGLLTEFRFWRN